MRAVLAIGDHVWLLETGRVALSGTAAKIRADQRAKEVYLGV
jgi:branched-chain amino acid transport system ATP-binding protein